MSDLLCTVCHQIASYDKFLAQHCGHVFCQDCTTYLSRERKCPTCRRKWGSMSPFRLYLNFPESGQIIHHLENTDESSSAFPLERMSEVIKDFIADCDNLMSHDTAMHLEQLVVPIASEFEHTRQENKMLRQKLKDADAQLKSKEVSREALTVDLERLNQASMTQEVAIITMRNELAHEKQKRQSEQDTSRRLARSLHKRQEEVKTKAHEIISLRSEIEEREKQMCLMKSKLRALIKLTRPPKIMDQSADNSLVVE